MAVGKVTFTRAERDKLAQVLWLLNWISVVTGVVIFSLGLLIKVELQKRREVMSDQDLLYVPHALIATGLAACCVNFLGGTICYDCVGGAKFARWKPAMAPYVAGAFCFTFCVLAGGLLCYGVRGQLDDSLRLGLRHAMRHYKDTDTPGRCTLKRSLDRLQIQLQCCGDTGYRDWFSVQWVSSRYLDMTSPHVLDRLRSNVGGQYLTDGVPFSCCSPFSPRPCIQHRLTNTTAHFNYRHGTDRLNLWTRGCRQVLLDHYTGILRSTGLVVLLIWLFELLVVTGVRYLQTAMENLLLLGDPDSGSDGWILESSLAETARWNLNIIKNLGKCYQSDDDPNINVPGEHRGRRQEVLMRQEVLTGQEVPTRQEVPMRQEVPTRQEVPMRQEVSTGQEVLMRQEVPTRKEVLMRQEVPTGQEVPLRQEVLMRQEVPTGQEVPTRQEVLMRQGPHKAGEITVPAASSTLFAFRLVCVVPPAHDKMPRASLIKTPSLYHSLDWLHAGSILVPTRGL
ncbi:hypothetical protein NHX12_026074 [Muraenolepis orangiensis]|uniref:Tetraspanin n=1 Tax=Muraenolepis orangiensis TaxID=630683 RepID=A0A9Q0IQE7_9TELE|nr:hypothetical protein NHX12_026074 [Muraenolepis orangiensis]